MRSANRRRGLGRRLEPDRICVDLEFDHGLAEKRRAIENAMRGTDATMAVTHQDGWAWVLIAVGHCTDQGGGIRAAKPGTRFDASDPVRQRVRERFGVLRNVARRDRLGCREPAGRLAIPPRWSST